MSFIIENPGPFFGWPSFQDFGWGEDGQDLTYFDPRSPFKFAVSRWQYNTLGGWEGVTMYGGVGVMSCGEKRPSLMMSSLGRARLEDGKFFWAIRPWKLRFGYSKRPIFERRYLLQTKILGINYVKFWGCKLQHVAAFLFNLLLIRFLIAPGRGRFAVSDSCLRPLVFGAFRFVWWSWAFVVTTFPTYKLFQHLFMVFETIRQCFLMDDEMQQFDATKETHRDVGRSSN